MIQLFAKVTAREGRREDLEAALSPIREAAVSEPGTITFRMYADAGDADVLWFYEEYMDAAAQAAHMSSDAFKAVGRAVRDLLASPLEVIPVTER